MKPATTVSPNNAMAVSVYLGSLILSLLMMFREAKAKSLTDFTGAGTRWMISLLMLVCSVGALLSIGASLISDVDRDKFLRLDFASNIGLGVVMTTYAATLTLRYGFSNNATTQTLVWTVGLGCLLRGVQAYRDARKFRAVVDAGVEADPAPLGDTTERG